MDSEQLRPQQPIRRSLAAGQTGYFYIDVPTSNASQQRPSLHLKLEREGGGDPVLMASLGQWPFVDLDASEDMLHAHFCAFGAFHSDAQVHSLTISECTEPRQPHTMGAGGGGARRRGSTATDPRVRPLAPRNASAVRWAIGVHNVDMVKQELCAFTLTATVIGGKGAGSSGGDKASAAHAHGLSLSGSPKRALASGGRSRELDRSSTHSRATAPTRASTSRAVGRTEVSRARPGAPASTSAGASVAGASAQWQPRGGRTAAQRTSLSPPPPPPPSAASSVAGDVATDFAGAGHAAYGGRLALHDSLHSSLHGSQHDSLGGPSAAGAPTHVPATGRVPQAYSGAPSAEDDGAVLPEHAWTGMLLCEIRRDAPSVLEVLRSWDTDGDGVVDVAEFRRAVRALGFVTAPRAAIDACFDILDVDHSRVRTGRRPAPLTHPSHRLRRATPGSQDRCGRPSACER